jgi:hypothetical protein
MKIRVGFAAALTFIVFLASSTVAMAESPAGRAIGWVQLVPRPPSAPHMALGVPDGRFRWVRFDVRQTESERLPVYGYLSHWENNPDGTRYRSVSVSVVYAVLTEDTAWFAGVCVDDTWDRREGEWLVVQVYDGGTPGAGVDRVTLQWVGSESFARARVAAMTLSGETFNVITGNLAVRLDD